LAKFCDYVGQEPDVIYNARLKHLKSDDIATRRQVEELVTQWIGQMQKDSVPSNTIATACGAVRSYFSANYVPLTQVFVPAGVAQKRTMLPTPSGLASMVLACEGASDFRTAAWICCQKDSGISGGDLAAITFGTKSPEFGTIKAQLLRKLVPIHVYIERGKGISRGLGPYDAYFGKDAIASLLKYVDLENIQNSMRIFPFSEKTHRNSVKDISEKIVSESNTPHDLRKFFNTYMKLAKVNESVIEYWMGHSLGKVKRISFRQFKNKSRFTWKLIQKLLCRCRIENKKSYFAVLNGHISLSEQSSHLWSHSSYSRFGSSMFGKQLFKAV
jgi:hypothetical protein